MFSQCPSCHHKIPVDRMNDAIVICTNCGSTQKNIKQRSDGTLPSFLVASLFTTATLISIFYLQSKWGNQAIEALAPHVRAITSQAVESDYKLLADISLRLGRSEESLSYLVKRVEIAPNNLYALEELADRHYRMKNWAHAAPVYYKFLTQGGVSTKAKLNYARILSTHNDVDQASKLFKSILDSKPGVFQVTVATSYINHLIQHGRKRQAIKTIKKFQRLGSNTKTFMKSDLKKLTRKRRS